jgi:hypothetical protein
LTFGLWPQGVVAQAAAGAYQKSWTTSSASVTESWYQLMAPLTACHTYVGVRVATAPDGATGTGVGVAGSGTLITSETVADHGP